MRKLILMTSAAVIAPLSCFAEDITCTATPNCADLGYTSTTSCDNGVKCPWGEAWYCPPSPPEVCEIGSILYSDMTCYKDAQAGKTPIGVVVYVDATGAGQALALNSLDTKYTWGGYGTDISSLPNYSSAAAAFLDLDSCGNTAKIIAAGDKSTYPAAWAAHEYSTEGTSAGDWCLPAAGIFTSIYNNKSTINTGFSRAGGTQITTSTYAWSSSERNGIDAWYSGFNYSYGLTYYLKNSYYAVRPVFEFVQTFEGVCKGVFKYTCKGEGYASGVGTSCGGRYSECSCAEGYEWWQGKCTQNCEVIGNILYSDKTCSKELDTEKTPIGVVVYVNGNGGGQAMALKSIGTYTWGGYGTDIVGLLNYSSASEALKDFASCENSKIIMAKGDKDTYPAVWAAHEYSTEGTEAGDWCLPAAGIFNSYKNNQTSVNLGFERANRTKFDKYTSAWSSSEYNNELAWYSYFDFNSGLSNTYKYYSGVVRPVIEF